jgi:hypothetical protein
MASYDAARPLSYKLRMSHVMGNDCYGHRIFTNAPLLIYDRTMRTKARHLAEGTSSLV